MAYHERTAERIRKLLSARRGVTEKKMMGGVCFMVKGRMCCSASGKGGILVRVGPDQRNLDQPHVRPMQMGARTLKGFVRIDPEGYATDAALKKWIGRGLDAVAGLPARPPRKTSTPTAPKRRAKAR